MNVAITLSELWIMESCTKPTGTGAQKRYIDLDVQGKIYRLNQDEAKALHRELGRMIKQIDARADLDCHVASQQESTP